ncbi:helix-turn-helix domain-containing protein [Actinomadura sp. 7K507]|uniref:helix-turn-helix domain-containing protein n=1 Tax=Actinomadura sp. 7K507 TaxID=2530365 RepID=UPI001A9E050F|nr:helix-turn-helix domain-containing protein [Actinomadura sp. 7K507]
MQVTQAYRFALDPTPEQERALCSHAGAARFAWNWGLAACIGRYDIEGRRWSGGELHRLWNQVKKTDPALGWWGESSKCVYQEAFRDLDRALRVVRSRKGARKGRSLGFPRFKKRGRCRDSFRFGAGAMRCSGRTVTLPRLGTIATHVSERTYLCDGCGLVLDRDVNAARNLLDLAASGAERQNACGGDVRPGPAGQPPAKQEPGTAHAGETGTAAAQATATPRANARIRSHIAGNGAEALA